MFREPPNLEVHINQFAVRTFARRYYKKLVKCMQLKGDEKVLDYGSGAGGPASYIIKKLNKGKGRLTCVDISKKWIISIKNFLRREKKIDFHLGSIMEVNIPDKAYDFINIHFVLHEIPSEFREEIVFNLVKKLKDGGKVFMREPMLDNSIIDSLTALFIKQGMHKLYAKEVKVPLSGKTMEVCLKLEEK